MYGSLSIAYEKTYAQGIEQSEEDLGYECYIFKVHSIQNVTKDFCKINIV
jgi:hypothetical protein